MVPFQVRPDRQTVLFSATFPKQIEKLAKTVLRLPLEIVVGERSTVNKDITQIVEVRQCLFLRLALCLRVYGCMVSLRGYGCVCFLRAGRLTPPLLAASIVFVPFLMRQVHEDSNPYLIQPLSNPSPI